MRDDNLHGDSNPEPAHAPAGVPFPLGYKASPDCVDGGPRAKGLQIVSMFVVGFIIALAVGWVVDGLLNVVIGSLGGTSFAFQIVLGGINFIALLVIASSIVKVFRRSEVRPVRRWEKLGGLTGLALVCLIWVLLSLGLFP